MKILHVVPHLGGEAGKSPERCNFRAAIGETPADWYAATQRLPGAASQSPARDGLPQPTKGTLRHFESVLSRGAPLARAQG